MLEAARFRTRGLSLDRVHRCVHAEAALEGLQLRLGDFYLVIKMASQRWDEPLTGHILPPHAGRLGTSPYSYYL